MTDASVSRGFDKAEDSPELSGWLDVLTDSGSDALMFCCPADVDVHLSVFCEIRVFLCVLTMISSTCLYIRILSVLLVQIKQVFILSGFGFECERFRSAVETEYYRDVYFIFLFHLKCTDET